MADRINAIVERYLIQWGYWLSEGMPELGYPRIDPCYRMVCPSGSGMRDRSHLEIINMAVRMLPAQQSDTLRHYYRDCHAPAVHKAAKEAKINRKTYSKNLQSGCIGVEMFLIGLGMLGDIENHPNLKGAN